MLKSASHFMPKKPIYREFAFNPPQSDQTLQEWLFCEIRSAILDGRLRPGARLPSSRSLALNHALSRSTVTEAFRRLKLEGYINGLTGSGSFVAENLPDQYFQSMDGNLLAKNRVLTKRAHAVAKVKKTVPFEYNQRLGTPFQAFGPAVDRFPVDTWARLTSRVLRRVTPSELATGDAHGDLGLRNEILAHFGPARQVRCDIDRIVVVYGVQHALDLLCRILLRPGDPVWLENPGYHGARNLFCAAGATIIPAPVDERGLQVERAIKSLPVPKLIYLTPAHQFPTGAALALDRRFKLLCWAREHGITVFEDDYDGDFRFACKPLGSVQGLDTGDCVAYCTSFSKLLFPSLRLGFLVLPEHLLDPVLALRKATDRYLPVLQQKTLAEFMRTGEFGHHLRRMRELYAERWAVLAEAAQTYLSDRLDVQRAECGLQTAAWLAPGISDVKVAAAAAKEQLEIHPISPFYAAGKCRHGFLLGFGAVAPKELRSGAQRLAKVLRGFTPFQGGSEGRREPRVETGRNPGLGLKTASR
jgi:GntR family transcriptional regulator / MocR family aminotransferase